MSSYRDYSTYLLNGGELIKHKKSDRNFPVKLHRIVSDPMNAHIITWLPHGRAFKVIRRDELIRDVIPGYFVCSKYESFTRQLTAWDYKRLKRGPDEGCYYHEAFLRGLPELTCFIRRLPRGGEKKAHTTPSGEPEEEPDLYRISVQRPVPPFPARPGGGGPPGHPGQMNPYGMPQQQQPQYGFPGYGYPPQPYGMGPPVPGYIPPIPPGGYPGYPPMGMPQGGPPGFPGHGMHPGQGGFPPGPGGGFPPGYPGGPQAGGPPSAQAGPSPPAAARQAGPKSPPEAEAPEQLKQPIPGSDDAKPESKPQSPKRKSTSPPIPEHKKPPTMAEEAKAAAANPVGQSPPFSAHGFNRYDVPPGAPPPPYNPNFPPYGGPPPGQYFQYPPMGGPQQPPPMGFAQAGYTNYPPPTPQNQAQQMSYFPPGSVYQQHQPQPSPHSQHPYSQHPPTPQHGQYAHAQAQQPPTPASEAAAATQPEIEDLEAEDDVGGRESAGAVKSEEGAPIPDDLDDVSSE